MSKKSKARKAVRGNHKVCWKSTPHATSNYTECSFSNYSLEELYVMPTNELVKMLTVADNGVYADFVQPFKLMHTAFGLAEEYNSILLKYFITGAIGSASASSTTIDINKFFAFKQIFTVDDHIDKSTAKKIKRIFSRASNTAKSLDVMVKTTLPKIFKNKKDMTQEECEIIYACLNNAKSALAEAFPNIFDEQGNVIG